MCVRVCVCDLCDPSPSEIGQCVQLVFLELQHNELQSLPDTVGNCTSLRRLGLRYILFRAHHHTTHVMPHCRYNKLAELPNTLCECTQLEDISLESNSLQSLPVSGRGFLASCPYEGSIILLSFVSSRSSYLGP